MKKMLLMLMLTSFSFALNSCNSDNTQEVLKYNVTFIVDGEKTIKEVEAGKSVEKPVDPQKDGYELIGWYTSSDCDEESKYDFNLPVNGNFELYACFKKIETVKSYVVTFELNGGTLDAENTQIVEEGKLVVKPVNPIKNGYNFVNWMADKALTTEFDFENTYINSDTTIYAKWEEVKVNTKYAITASSSFDALTKADYAADGNDETYWKAKDNSYQELIIDLKNVKEITNVTQEFVDLNAWNFKILGSIDGTNYAEIISNYSSQVGSRYERDLLGYYRYIKLAIDASQVIPTSKEFSVSYNELDKGTNIAYGMKGIADCWAGGFEIEKAFDGNLTNYHCANSSHENHYMGIEALSNYYVTDVEIYFPDSVDHKFYIDYRDLNGSWIAPETGNFNNNQESSNYFKIDINAELNALLIHYNGNSFDKWPAASEIKVNGFKLSETTVNEDTIDLGSLSYLSRIKVNDIDENATFKVSSDNITYNDVHPEIKDGYYVFNQEARYLKVSSETLNLNDLQVYSKSFYRNLALLTTPTATTHSSDAGFWENMMTLNKDCKDANSRFYCSSAGGLKEEINLDFGVNIQAKNIVYKYQDYSELPIYKLIIEVSSDGKTYEKVLDTTENADGASNGQIFKAEFKTLKEFRYLKISTEVVNGFTNCNTLEVNGIGSPIL